ncbi:uncharacterized protein BJ212DRAFT_1481085 [Suillus subaureus]|uniref:Uncharacterized protein n=1 Tax=Suillus subaureus TaxID=48587 RepID=A0A9P7EB49_9AGAM|nr:uncharacterized protein BJ212DRAFT_1481085 [Suillus subaureus]KAG1816021.1 hypothetical protein BJ212DRAFT_1481085 [Suillus subaureus]
MDHRRIGHRHHLTSEDVAFLHGSLDKTCDSYLNELKVGLEEICGVSVSIPTVWCALQRSRYSMKKVYPFAILFCLSCLVTADHTTP